MVERGGGVTDDDRIGLVIPFKVPTIGQRAESPLVQRRKRERPYCGHWGAEVDAQAREVTCQECGADLDPIEVLNRLAFEEMKLIWSKEERDKLLQEREDLKREIRNLKAQKRRAEKDA